MYNPVIDKNAQAPYTLKTRPKGFYNENVEVYPNEMAGEGVRASLFTRAIVKGYCCVVIYPEFCVLCTDHAERSKSDL